MTPPCTLGSTRVRRLRELVARCARSSSTAIGGFLLGFVVVAVWLLPQTLIRGESAVPNVVGLALQRRGRTPQCRGIQGARPANRCTIPPRPKTSVLGQTPGAWRESAEGQ